MILPAYRFARSDAPPSARPSPRPSALVISVRILLLVAATGGPFAQLSILPWCPVSAKEVSPAESSTGKGGCRSSAGAAQAPEPTKRWTRESVEMAAPLRMVCYHGDEVAAQQAMTAAIERIRELNGVFSDYDETSEVRRLCETAGKGQRVKVSKDLWQVLEFSLKVSEQTEGAFDVTIGPLVRLWRRARMARELPPPWRFEEARRSVGYQFVRLYPEEQAVELLRPGMRLDFGAVAKGYAIDAALETMRKHGVPSALVDLGGDIGLGDPPADRPAWTVAVAPIRDGESPEFFVRTSRCGVATSGDRYRFVVINGQRYSHIVDPRTGVGLTDQSEVTVIAPDATTADALATAVSVLGPEKGLALVDALPGTAALYLRLKEDRVEVHQSQRWTTLAGGDGDARP